MNAKLVAKPLKKSTELKTVNILNWIFISCQFCDMQTVITETRQQVDKNEQQNRNLKKTYLYFLKHFNTKS